MARVKSRNLYDLIKSLDRNEKRYVKLILQQTGDSDDKKVLILFDLINKQDEFDEDKILQKAPMLKPDQLSNLKAYLYNKILQGIRAYNLNHLPDIKIRELIDFAEILFSRRLFSQGMECLKSAKKLSIEHENLELQLEIIKLEKSVLMATIDHDNVNKVDRIVDEVDSINKRLNLINAFSNLYIKLNALYTKLGYVRNEDDYLKVKEFYFSNMPFFKESNLANKEKVYLYRLELAYYLFIQDFESGYVYAKKLVETIESHPTLIQSDPENYARALNSLLSSQYKMFRYDEFLVTKKKLEGLSSSKSVEYSENLRVMLLKYHFIHEINYYFMTGHFQQGVQQLIDNKEAEIEELIKSIDKHSLIIFYYKIASLYVGAGQFNKAIKWLNKIINTPNDDLREDIHCFARMLNLICHFELGNYDVISYYIRSTYRFLLKKDDLHMFQKYILGFLRTLKRIPSTDELHFKFNLLKEQLTPLVNSRYEKRAFVYFDILSWLNSKLSGKTVQEVIEEKALRQMQYNVMAKKL
ncbi:MAG: hypothetical protein SNJ77_01170 [Cytophagales bacterium]